jgi:hypothetical protein
MVPPAQRGDRASQGDLAPLALNLVAGARASQGVVAIYSEVLILFTPNVVFTSLFLKIGVNSTCAGFALVEERLDL